MTSVSLGRQAPSVGFLSRMWGSASKNHGHDKDAPQAAISKARMGIGESVRVDSAESLGPATAALRKIVHKRSIVFRGGVA